jgi:hypothetical protein
MEFGEQLQTVKRALDEGLISPEQQRQIQVGLIDGMSEAAANGNELVASFQALDEAVADVSRDSGNEFASGFERQANRIGDSLADALMTGDFDGAGSAIGASIGSSISDAVGDTLSKQLGNSLGQQFGSALGAGIGGAVGGVVGAGVGQAAGSLLDDVFGGSDYDPTADRQAAQGTGTVLGSIDAKSGSIDKSVDEISSATDELVNINTGMLRSLEQVQNGIARASAMIAQDRSGIDFQLGGVSPELQATRGLSFLGGAGLGTAVGSGAIGGSLGTSLTTTLIGGLGGAGLGVVVGELMGDELNDIIGDAVGELDSLLGGALSDIGGSVFGGDRKIVDDGIRIIGGEITDLMNNVAVQAFATIKEDGGWFGSDDYWDEFKALPQSTARQFSAVFRDITETVTEGADALGVMPGKVQDRLDDFVVNTRQISLEGLDADEKAEEINSVFSSIFDRLTSSVVPYLDDFQNSGEGLGETMARLASQIGVLDELAQTLDSNISGITGRNRAEVATDLASQLGGTEQFAQAIAGIEDQFLSEAEQFEAVSRRLGEALGDMNLPQTRDGYLELMRAQDLASESGREHAATLIRLRSSADDYYSFLEDRQSESLEQARSAMQSFRGEIDSVSSALDSMTQTPAQREMSRLDAVDTLRNALATGDFSGVGDAAQTAANLDASQFSTREQFIRAQGMTGGLLREVEERGQRQLTEAERQVNLAEEANSISRSQLSALEGIESALSSASVPGFASGGIHTGGARIVGERGPELEFTGPSRIASNSQTRDLLSMDGVIQELRQLRQQIDRLNQLNYQTTKNTGKTSDRLRKWDNAGQPPEREAI